MDVSENIDDPELRRLAGSEGVAWFSIDLMRAITSEPAALRFIAKALVVHLAPSDAAFVGNPAGDVLAFDEQARRLLEEGSDPFSIAC